MKQIKTTELKLNDTFAYCVTLKGRTAYRVFSVVGDYVHIVNKNTNETKVLVKDSSKYVLLLKRGVE